MGTAVQQIKTGLRVLPRGPKLLVGKILILFYIWMHRRLHKLNILPIDRNFGEKRGTPVGRYYVERFLRRNGYLINGRCLEFGDNRYRSLFARARSYEVISLSAGPHVDYACDIHQPVGIPEAAFDSVICTQVLEHLAFPENALKNIFRFLKPGGILLLTAPFINNIHYGPTDFRRFTPDGVRLIVEAAGFIIEELDYGGNSAVATGSLLGMVAEDFLPEEMDRQDPVYPYNILVRARRPSAIN